jgi:hypothetical protein
MSINICVTLSNINDRGIRVVRVIRWVRWIRGIRDRRGRDNDKSVLNHKPLSAILIDDSNTG